MEGKADPQRPANEEFEPFCKWDRNVDRDIIEIHLKEFKKDQLKVQLSNRRVLKIFGERPLDASTKSIFYKEVSVPVNTYDTPAIHAKFTNGCLYITMPKRKSLGPQISRSTSTGEQKIDRSPKLGDHFKGPHPKDVDRGAEGDSKHEHKDRRRRGLRLGKVAISLAATAAAVAVMVAYVVYMYKATVYEVDG
ncbi:hypothetical protein CDL12_13890 [Handroanthus impetiginosus]|uniref:SHSP domain-containing protein n=1 Tax=Handroanthus impetiginosus TaxID=429701 RepID=A0A2G9H7I9_9LAMI|nr:hypothetical protein CDL12_13890 [Handroanthus impetiginosus]